MYIYIYIYIVQIMCANHMFIVFYHPKIFKFAVFKGTSSLDCPKFTKIYFFVNSACMSRLSQIRHIKMSIHLPY